MRDRKNYRKIFEDHHQVKIPKGWHIHHIDGNRHNNEITNLEMLSPDEHAQKHGYISNWVMAQDRASKMAIEKLKTPEMRKKMRESMINSDAHKAFIESRSQNEVWRKNVSESARRNAKNRIVPESSRQSMIDKLTGRTAREETKKLMSEQRTGRKWHTDGEKSYFIHPTEAQPHYRLGRK